MPGFWDLSEQNHKQTCSSADSAANTHALQMECDEFSHSLKMENVPRAKSPIAVPFLSHHKGNDQQRLSPSDTGPAHSCRCMNCLFIGTLKAIDLGKPKLVSGEWQEEFLPEENNVLYSIACRFPGCEEQKICGSRYLENPEDDGWLASMLKPNLAEHERTHFGKAGAYHCREKGCQTETNKFADLKRHCLVKHCTNPTKFPCSILGCRYGGDNGFTREDKLKSHYRNVHKGKIVPGKAFQPLKPKTEGTKFTKAKAQGSFPLQPKPSVDA